VSGWWALALAVLDSAGANQARSACNEKHALFALNERGKRDTRNVSALHSW
jgi:hypothetical protein